MMKNTKKINEINIPCVTASCPRCDLLFSEILDESIFSKEELIAVEWAANFFNNMANQILPQPEANKAREQAQVLNNLLERFYCRKLDDFKKRLSQIVNEDYIESWLQKPNAAFNNRKPIDLINEDNYQPLYDMIYRLGSGEPLS